MRADGPNAYRTAALSALVVTVWIAGTFSFAPEVSAGGEGAETRATEAAQRGLSWLTREGEHWRREQRCSSCHHIPMLVWALSLAGERGLAVDEAALRSTRREAVEEYLASDFRPTPGLDTQPLSLGALYLLLGATEGGDKAGEGDLRRFVEHIRGAQLADGSWAGPEVAGPDSEVEHKSPLYDTREVMTGWALLALGPSSGRAPEVERALGWLEGRKGPSDTQAAVVRLLLARRFRPGQLPEERQELLRRQRADGGWGQTPGGDSDAFATGQALYALGMSGLDSSAAPVRNGWRSLLREQREDGSWFVKSRSPEMLGLASSYAGTAWAVMGLCATLGAEAVRVKSRTERCRSRDGRERRLTQRLLGGGVRPAT